MFCTNCGAQVSPEEKFCLKCGSPVNPAAVNIGGGNPEAGGPYMSVKGYVPQQIPIPAEPKKTKIWPIVVGVLAATLVLAVGLGIAIRAAVKRVIARTESYVEDQVEEFADDFVDDYSDIDDIMEEFGLDGIDPYDYNFDDFDVDEFLEEYGNYDDYLDGESGSADDIGDYEFKQYEFADAYYADEYNYLMARGVINDSTVIFGGKKIGDFCDYIDSQVLDGSRRIDRDLLYDLMEVHLVDTDLIKDNTQYFEQTMMYCLTFANEFGNLDMDVEACSYYTEDPTTYYYNVEAGDRDDTWIVDYTNEQVYMHEGKTEYTSAGANSMFSKNTLSVWLVAIDEFFEIG